MIGILQSSHVLSMSWTHLQKKGYYRAYESKFGENIHSFQIFDMNDQVK